jgi:hypothetical protein
MSPLRASMPCFSMLFCSDAAARAIGGAAPGAGDAAAPTLTLFSPLSMPLSIIFASPFHYFRFSPPHYFRLIVFFFRCFRFLSHAHFIDFSFHLRH